MSLIYFVAGRFTPVHPVDGGKQLDAKGCPEAFHEMGNFLET